MLTVRMCALITSVVVAVVVVVVGDYVIMTTTMMGPSITVLSSGEVCSTLQRWVLHIETNKGVRVECSWVIALNQAMKRARGWCWAACVRS